MRKQTAESLQMIDEAQTVATYALGGTGVLTLIAWGARKVFTQLLASQNDASKSAADSEVFNNLRLELKRMSDDIRILKEEHAVERIQLNKRIDELSARVTKLTNHLTGVRRHAIDAITALTSRECKSPCPAIDSALIHLKDILNDENV